jgi:cell division protein FtsQ
MKNWKIHSILSVLIVILSIYGFGLRPEDNASFQSMTVDKELISAEKLQTYLGLYVGDSLDTAINIRMLEEKLKLHPAVDEAEVYSTLNGELYLAVSLYRPLARWLQDEKDLFITEDGLIPTDVVDGTARAPLIFGALSDEDMEGLRRQLSLVQADAYWSHQITAWEHKQNQWVLHSRKGGHLIRLRKEADVLAQLGKLKTVYDSILDKGSWTAYKEFDLRFEDQVVCLKR